MWKLYRPVVGAAKTACASHWRRRTALPNPVFGRCSDTDAQPSPLVTKFIRYVRPRCSRTDQASSGLANLSTVRATPPAGSSGPGAFAGRSGTTARSEKRSATELLRGATRTR